MTITQETVAPVARRRFEWALLLAGGLASGLAMNWVGVPAGLMLGPLALGAVMAHKGAGVRVPRLGLQAAQGVVGCLIATRISTDVFAEIGAIWPVVVIFVALTLAAASVVGFVSGRLTGIDREVSIWGFLPGMAGTVIAMAEDRGLDSRLVALIQMVRLMVVIATMVTVAMLLTGPAAPLAATDPVTAGSTLRVLGLAALGVAAARYVPVFPSAASLLPMAAAIVLKLSGFDMAMPLWLVALGYLAIGAQIGLRMTPDLFAAGLRALPKLIGASLLLMALCAVSGVALALITGQGLMSALLATVPGSVDSIALIAVNSHADVTFVMTLQTLRLFAVALLGPAVARSLVRLSDRMLRP